jgi:hypothetical protein
MENFLEAVVKASQANVMVRKLPPASTRLDRIQACIPASHGARARKYYERTDLQTSVSTRTASGASCVTQEFHRSFKKFHHHFT